jgi:RNA polymerase sigma factor (sigma-70 family)
LEVSGARLQDSEQIISQLHQAYSRRIYFFARRELRSHATAEDVSHETLVRVMEAVRAGKLASPEALPGFVSGTARNVIHEFRRKEGRAGPLGDLEFPAPEQPAPVDPAVRRAMEIVLKRLKPRERDFLRLYYYEDLSKEEISERLGIVPERMRLVKSRALKSFREFYLRLTKGEYK